MLLLAWQTNPLNKFDKSRNFIPTESYIDRAVNSVLDVDKIFLDENKSANDGFLANVLAVDKLEIVMLGLGKIQNGTDETTGELFPYQKELNRINEMYKTMEEEDLGSQFSKVLYKKNKLANLKFQILLSAIQRSKPITVEMKG